MSLTHLRLKARNNKKAVRSGGVALLVKSNLCKYAQILHGSSLDVLCFYLNEPLVQRTVLCGVT